MTELDRLHDAMEAGGEAERLAFWDGLAAAELFLLLEREPQADRIAPRVIESDGASYLLAFDGTERLAAFAGAGAHYAGMPGRALAQMMAGQGLGLGLNLGDAPSATLLPAEAIDWLANALSGGPEEGAGRPVEIGPPSGLPQTLLAALDRRLSRAAGLAEAALLVRATWEDGREGHLLAIVGAAEGAERALAGSVSDALTFSGLEDGALDVAFLAHGAPLARRMAGVALRFDLPSGETPARAAPGSDPDAPPRLR